MRLANIRKRLDRLEREPADVTGVHMHQCGKYEAQLSVNGRNVYLGLYPTLSEAAAARRGAELFRRAV